MNYQRFEDEIPANKNQRKSQSQQNPLLIEQKDNKEIELAQVFYCFRRFFLLKSDINIFC